ncbi:class I SAM-dependent methyltransferase [Microcoleus sp. FACHB-831]|uniref:class I SAM-dependent methyltransferase n=1 Tax=Microcoleus sp. FACHB-831 TaxID=2692827 RepID=UPI001688C753|nr:class I SAM-dependent methyltransferase [Microcoleus sp. FACHB-831]MBD1920064.1 class I SAM-dependent methyltransferase [Microcoleus sp. FACHB-831]
MQRILEPEVMDSAEEAVEYDAMDFTEVNTAFAKRAIELASTSAIVLDAGTGTARIPILICQQRPQWHITGIDMAKSMLEIGRKNVDNAGLQQQIKLELADAKGLPYRDEQFDMVISNSLIHHLPEPLPFLQEIKRVMNRDGAILLRDLIRPESAEIINNLVESIGEEYDEHQKNLFRDSLYAAFTLDEVKALIQQAGLPDVNVYQSSDRHWTAEKYCSIKLSLSSPSNEL